jgi:putative N6-adenine-specific DNA methylase
MQVKLTRGERKLEAASGGRPGSLPAPRRRKPSGPPAGKSPRHRENLRWFAIASPGLETSLHAELAVLRGVADLHQVEGGVEFSGPLGVGMAANLHSRIATRIVARMGEVLARDFPPLRRRLARLPWRSFVPADRALRIDVSTSHCRLYHTGALADTLSLAVEDCVGKLPEREKKSDPKEDDDSTRLLLRGQDDRFVASVDSSGALLHRRGWRLEAGAAPMRETLAAGILALCDYDPALPLLDPMCGSGTIAIEAAAMAQGIPPGAGRAFAFERWPCHDRALWQSLRASPVLGVASTPHIFAMDRDGRAVEIARRNALRAQVDGSICFAVSRFGDSEIPATPGLVLINPPYGRRLGQRQQALRLGRDIGRTLLARYHGWRAGVLCPDPTFMAAVTAGMHRPPAKTYTLRNGGLRVHLGLWVL